MMFKASSTSISLSKPVVDALGKGKKIRAIKLLREEHSLELKEVKRIIDQYIQHNPTLRTQFSHYQSEAGRSILFFILIVLAFVTVIYFL